MEEVKQFKIFFSNQLDSLAKKLYGNLYPTESDPFKERLVIVPNKGIKFWLERKLAKEAIFFGIELLPLDSALARLLPQESRMPSHIALTMALYERLPSSLLEEDPLFAEKLATHFQRYALYGYSCFTRWEKEPQGLQQKLWKELFGEKGGLFTPLARALRASPLVEPKCHLFGLSHLSRPVAHFFRERGSHFYQLSFCEGFWSDILSDKEALLLPESYEGEAPPLLANFSLVMRKGLAVLEEGLSEQEEEYQYGEPISQLKKLQQHTLLFEKSDHLHKDDSLQLHQAPTRLREVEILSNRLLQWMTLEGCQLQDILILAPDISLYLPYLRALIPLPLLSLESKSCEESAEIEALFIFLGIEKRRFSSAAIMEFLSHPLVKKRRAFTEEELKTIRNWMEILHVRWGFDLEHKNRLLRHQLLLTHPLKEEKNSFKAALEHLLDAIALSDDLVKVSQLELLFHFHEIIHQLYKDSSYLYSEEKRSLAEYCDSIERMALFYFCDEKSLSCRLLQQIREQGEKFQENKLSFKQFVAFLEATAKKTSLSQPNEGNGLVCASLSTGSQIPSKITYILGLDEEFFPRKEIPSSLDLLRKEKIEEFLPTKADFDRSFFLEALFSCKERLILSYGDHPSLLVQELEEALASVTKYRHPRDGFHLSYFTSDDPHYRSYSKREYQLLALEDKRIAYPASKAKIFSPKIELKELLRFVKSPLKHTLKHKVGLYFTHESELKEEEEFTLSPLERALMVRRPEPIISQVEELQARSAFPQGTFGMLALRNAQKKKKEQREIFAFHGIDPKGFSSLSLDEKPLQIGSYQLIGRIENVLPRALFVYEKGDCAGALSAYPAFLALNCVREAKELLFGKEEKRLERFFDDPEPHLEKIIEFYLWAKERETLLYPELIEPILKKDATLLTKRMVALKTNSYDEALAFTFRHRSWPNAEELIETLYEKVHHCYQEPYESWF